MTENKTIFKKYHEIHSDFLDSSDQIRKDWFHKYFQKNYLPLLLDIKKDSKILEIGCGRGMLCKSFYDSGYKNITGIDLSEGDIDIAKKTFVEINFISGDADIFLETTSDKYDLVILKAVLEHVEKKNIGPMLKSISKNLADQGKIIIDVPNMNWFFATHERYLDITHEVGFTKESLSQVVRLYFKDLKINESVDYFNKNFLREFLMKFFRYFLTIIFSFADPDGAASMSWSRSIICKASKK